MAAAFVGAAQRAGIDVPSELSVVGHDDTPLASMLEPRLTTVRVDTVGLGRFLAQLALAAVEDRPEPAVGPDLRVAIVERASTAEASPRP